MSSASSRPAAPDIADGRAARPAPPAGPQGSRGSGSYGEILRSTGVIGGVTLLNMALGVVRAKAMAVLLGPAGFGLMGIYLSVADLARGIASMGVSSSGVRQIAASVATSDAQRIARTARVLRMLTVVLGVAGALLLAALATPVSVLTFGTGEQAAAVSLLAVAVLLRIVAEGQSALLQGMRRLGDLARSSLLGALIGTIASIPLVYLLRERGVVPAIVAISAASLLTSWWFSRRLRAADAGPLRWPQFAGESIAMLKLGVAFMASGLLTIGAAYVVRLIVLRQGGLEEAGLYQAAWTLGGLYAGLVLQAMGTDFYPRLVAVIGRHGEANRIVNEQTTASLLLAAPGVIATLTFAPWVLSLFYSEAFVVATETLRWMGLGMALRIVTWPLGYVVVAKNDQRAFFATELLWTAANLAMSWFFVQWWGLAGAGIAFFVSYLLHWAMVHALARRSTGFEYDRTTGANLLVYAALLVAVAVGFRTLPPAWATLLGALATAASAAYSVRMLLRLSSSDGMPASLRRLFRPRPARPRGGFSR